MRRPSILIAAHKRRIRVMLERRDYKRAEDYYQSVRHCYTPAAYQQVRAHFWQQHRDEVMPKLADLLLAFRFQEANALAEESIIVVAPHEYQDDLKAPAIQRYFHKEYDFNVNDEQAKALACPARHVLVKARAGTGKTRVIVSKAVLSMVEEGLHPDQILMLAFNRDAAHEMLNRMRDKFNFPEFSTAKTFHSLAYRIVNPTKALLDDDYARLTIAEKAMRPVWTTAFRKLANVFFRIAEDTDLLSDKTLDPESYYTYRRVDLKLVGLSGVRVKSVGEKWIADFLFEHGVFFEYEQHFQWDGQPYRPDFTLKDPNAKFQILAVLEHWGVCASDKDGERSFPNGMTAGQYRAQIDRKRQYWKEKDIQLIETSLDDMCQGREMFEKIFHHKLEAVGMPHERRPDIELREALEKRCWDELSKLMLQFIDRAKNRRLKAKDIKAIWRSIPKSKVRMRVFWHLAARVYGAYEQILQQENKMDFQDLLEDAADRIEEEHGNLTFIPERGKNPVPLDDLKWVLIDEYQDFSTGFDYIVKTLRKHNPALRVFCVGDDWQTINRFAGSEPIYFQNFRQNLPDADEALLRINHRSSRKIVETSNRLMATSDVAGVPLSTMPVGKVSASYVDQFWLDALPKNGANGTNAMDGKNVFDPGFMRAKTIAVCCGLITSLETTTTSVAILSRTNRIFGQQLFDFQTELLHCVEATGTVPNSFHVSTIHKFKGLEADIVILLDVTAGQVPLIHKHNELLSPFLPEDADPFEESLIDERRLFYVALSRATNQLWILSESGRRSPFLDCLKIKMVHPKTIAILPVNWANRG